MAKKQNDEVPILDDNVERDKDEEPLQFPGDPRPGWVKENVDIEGRKPDMEEIEEDTTDL